MAEARYLLKPDAVEYGPVCPECAGPKHRQSKRCADCYYDARRRGEFPPPPVPARKPERLRVAGGSKGRPQSRSHPWRGENALLFRARAPEAMPTRKGTGS